MELNSPGERVGFGGNKAVYIHPSTLQLHAHCLPKLWTVSTELVWGKRDPRGSKDGSQDFLHTAISEQRIDIVCIINLSLCKLEAIVTISLCKNNTVSRIHHTTSNTYNNFVSHLMTKLDKITSLLLLVISSEFTMR